MSEGSAPEALMKLKGVIKVALLSSEDRAEVERLEREAEGRVLMGIARGVNLGVREALSKKVVYGCVTDVSFRWPKASLVRVVCDGEVVGEDVYDEGELERLKSEGNMVLGNFVFYRDKVRLMKERREKVRVIMLPLRIPELEGTGMVVGSPSPPADLYLRRKRGYPDKDPKIGSIIVGFYST